jgi:hypothetical protein
MTPRLAIRALKDIALGDELFVIYDNKVQSPKVNIEPYQILKWSCVV